MRRVATTPGGLAFWAWNRQLKLAVTPAALFSPGHVHFLQRANGHVAAQWGLPFVVHTTFQWGGAEGKVLALKEAGLWLNVPSEYYSPDLKLLVYDNHLPDFLKDGRARPGLLTQPYVAAWQLHTLRDALAVAQILGRTLVLPEFMCHCDREEIWGDIMRADPKDGEAACTKANTDLELPFKCGLEYYVDPQRLKDENVPYRESSFLLSEHLPQSILQSQRRVE
ncbi:hypothetical protein CYMTET_27397, partial [Cymbomonas tetramitiformis]